MVEMKSRPSVRLLAVAAALLVLTGCETTTNNFTKKIDYKSAAAPRRSSCRRTSPRRSTTIASR